jgi:hypothetical protein
MVAWTEGDLVQHVGGLVSPTTLMSGARKDFLDHLPESERAVADREVRRDAEVKIFSSVLISPRLRTLARRISTGPIPVWMARRGP